MRCKKCFISVFCKRILILLIVVWIDFGFWILLCSFVSVVIIRICFKVSNRVRRILSGIILLRVWVSLCFWISFCFVLCNVVVVCWFFFRWFVCLIFWKIIWCIEIINIVVSTGVRMASFAKIILMFLIRKVWRSFVFCFLCGWVV